MGRLLHFIGSLGILVVVLLWALITVPKFVGYDVYHITGNEMKPNMPAGTLIYAKEIGATEYSNNDIVVFNRDNKVTVRRVVRNSETTQTLRVKGDANSKYDPDLVHYDDIRGKVTMIIPKLGTLMVMMTSAKGKLYMIAVLVLGIVFRVLGRKLMGSYEEE